MLKLEKQQCLLSFLGFYDLRRKDGSLAIDGLPGPATTGAIEKAQSTLGLGVTGIWDDSTEKGICSLIGNRQEPQIPEKPEASGSFWENPRVKPFFQQSEFACPCPRCGGFPAEPAEELVWACVEVREEANRRKPGTVFLISSGVRCQAHNDELPGSVPDSRHVRGRAVDFFLPGFSSQEILEMAQANPRINFAYIMDSGWVHMDIGN